MSLDTATIRAMAFIEASGLVKTYHPRGAPVVRALDGLDLSVPEGTVAALLGPNGAGKTTTVKVLTTLIRPDAGSATIDGVDVLADPQQIRRMSGASGQYAAVDENLTGFENLFMVGMLYHLGRRRAAQRARELIELFDLVDAQNRPVKGFSGGMRRRIDLAGALVIKPPVLFLDEPTTGLDPRSRLGLWDVIETLVSDGTTVLLTTQYLEEAVYGLIELNRDRVGPARLIANPGCYPTSAILALAPAVKEGLVEPDIVVDRAADSGTIDMPVTPGGRFTFGRGGFLVARGGVLRRFFWIRRFLVLVRHRFSYPLPS